MEVQRSRDGLWRWTVPHPAWTADGAGAADRPQQVGCVYYEAADATVLIDPLVPSDDREARRFWDALDADVARRRLPVAVLLTVTLHERSCADVRRRYGATLDAAAGVEALPLGDPLGETAFLIGEHRALVTGDFLVGSDVGGGAAGGIDVAPTAWFDDSEASRDWYAGQAAATLTRLRARPIEMVLVSHGTPVLADGTRRVDEAAARLRDRQQHRG